MNKREYKLVNYTLRKKHNIEPQEIHLELSSNALMLARFNYKNERTFSVFLIKDKSKLYWYCFPYYHSIFRIRARKKKDFDKVLNAMAKHISVYS